jgi:hypothetical protein
MCSETLQENLFERHEEMNHGTAADPHLSAAG